MEEKIIEMIEVLAAKLGVAAPHLWEVLLEQTRIEAAFHGIYVFITAVIIGVGVKTMRWSFSDDCTDAEGGALAFIFGLAGTVIGIVAFVINLTIVIGMRLNPEFYALKFLLGG